MPRRDGGLSSVPTGKSRNVSKNAGITAFSLGAGFEACSQQARFSWGQNGPEAQLQMIENMVELVGLEPTTSSLRILNSVRDDTTPKKSE
jgi:hypothetical protein